MGNFETRTFKASYQDEILLPSKIVEKHCGHVRQPMVCVMYHRCRSLPTKVTTSVCTSALVTTTSGRSSIFLHKHLDRRPMQGKNFKLCQHSILFTLLANREGHTDNVPKIHAALVGNDASLKFMAPRAVNQHLQCYNYLHKFIRVHDTFLHMHNMRSCPHPYFTSYYNEDAIKPLTQPNVIYSTRATLYRFSSSRNPHAQVIATPSISTAILASTHHVRGQGRYLYFTSYINERRLHPQPNVIYSTRATLYRFSSSRNPHARVPTTPSISTISALTHHVRRARTIISIIDLPSLLTWLTHQPLQRRYQHDRYRRRVSWGLINCFHSTYPTIPQQRIQHSINNRNYGQSLLLGVCAPRATPYLSAR